MASLAARTTASAFSLSPAFRGLSCVMNIWPDMCAMSPDEELGAGPVETSAAVEAPLMHRIATAPVWATTERINHNLNMACLADVTAVVSALGVPASGDPSCNR